MMEATKILADFIVKSNFDEIPREGVNLAKQAFLDCVGVTLAGSISPQARIVIEMVRENGGQPKAVVMGGGFRTSSPEAALANGNSAHALDYDDTNSLVMGHPSVFLVPTILALGEELGISGIKALEAYIIGLEAAARVGRGMTRSHYYAMGWHATATIGTLGAAVAAAKILKLNADQTRMALGIAASSSSGSRQNFGTMTKALHAGNAARNGIVASTLAKKGFTADKNILEAKFGFYKLFSKDDKYDLQRITDRLGQPFVIVSPGINIKPYPACRRTHSALDAMLELVKEHNISAQDVESVEVRVDPSTPQVLIHSNPRSGLEGKFSMEFCMAIAILNKHVGLGEFTDEKVLDVRTQEMMKKVKMILDPNLVPADKPQDEEHNPSIVRIKHKNGQEFKRQIDFPKGNPLVPMNREELLMKYHDCAERALSKKAVEQSLDLIDNLEKIKDLRSLADVFINVKK
jgi:2-methylcitrate dehydratase PrpD